VLLALVGLVLLPFAPPARALDRPALRDLRGAPGVDRIADEIPAPTGFWGGEYATRTGERVRVFSSPTYTVDPAANQRWADFVAGLLHGPELTSVTVYLAAPAEVSALCGGNPDVRGCYSSGRIIGLGEDTQDATAEAVLAHEYGHHVAANRSNAPWPALGWGTKRWSSYLDVCRLARAKEIFPGAEGPLLYFFNPGEGFAEAYRLLSERRAGLPESPWRIVDEMYRPDARALALIQQDVLDPWRVNGTVTRSGRFVAGGTRTRVFRVATPRDGELTASVSGNARLVGAPKRLVCGARTTVVRVARSGAPGPFRLTASRP
jgi:hypothetical protein